MNVIVMYERVELLCDKIHARMYVCIVCGCLDVEHYRIMDNINIVCVTASSLSHFGPSVTRDGVRMANLKYSYFNVHL